MRKIVAFIFFTNLFILSPNAQVPDSLIRLFSYTKTPHPVYVKDSSFVEGFVRVEKVRIVGQDSFIISAYITRPDVAPNHNPLIIYNHWGEGNKNEFLDEAIALSEDGFICILLDAPWLCPGSLITSFKRQGFEMVRQAVINSRVALDLAEGFFHTDPEKIFYVGHSFGCASGAILSGIEKRIDYFVFMTGVYSTTKNAATTTLQDFVDWRTSDPEQFSQWVMKMKPLDPDRYLPYKTKPCLIQVADQDEYLSTKDNEMFIDVTAHPKEVRHYTAFHSLNEEAQLDRMTWIREHLE